MTTVFVGGSRRISKLPQEARERLERVVEQGFPILVGDANGADKAVQKRLLDLGYGKVTIFCSDGKCRNNVGNWPTRAITPERGASGFHFYAAKDRVMAKEADFGLMLWDGESSGTLLNVLRLINESKKVVLVEAPTKATHTFKTDMDWRAFLATRSDQLRRDLRQRATEDEWHGERATTQDPLEATSMHGPEESVTALNAALASGDPRVVVDLLGDIARRHGMSRVAKDTGLAREALYRALNTTGNPEFATVMKVAGALGFRLAVGTERHRT
jgi:probable addiction module antidote protein